MMPGKVVQVIDMKDDIVYTFLDENGNIWKRHSDGIQVIYDLVHISKDSDGWAGATTLAREKERIYHETLVYKNHDWHTIGATAGTYIRWCKNCGCIKTTAGYIKYPNNSVHCE